MVAIELLAQMEPGIEEFFVGGGVGNAYKQAVIAFGFYGDEFAYLGVSTSTDTRVDA